MRSKDMRILLYGVTVGFLVILIFSFLSILREEEEFEEKESVNVNVAYLVQVDPPEPENESLVDFEQEVDQPYFFPKKRYFPRPQYKKTNERYGYYFGNVDPKTGIWRDEPLPLDENEIDCDKHNKEYLEMMYRMEILVDIEERKLKYNFTAAEELYIEQNNKHYMHFFEELYSYACEYHFLRRSRRRTVKKDVKWKEGDTVIIQRLKHNPGWNAYTDLKYINCSVDYIVTGVGEQVNYSHVKIFDKFDTRIKIEREKPDGHADNITDHYIVYESIESTSQNREEGYKLAFKNYDFLFSFHVWSEIPVYYDWDFHYTLVQQNQKAYDKIRKNAGWGVDQRKTYEQLRQETINWINKNHDHSLPLSHHTTHCEDNFHKKGGFENNGPEGHFRNIIINFLRQRGLEVINYGGCSNMGKLSRAHKTSGIKAESKQVQNNYHPFNIAFENKEIDSYSTEKLFQGMLSKYSVVIYFGDPHVRQRFPMDLLDNYKVFIDVRDFDSPSHLVEYLKYLLANQTAYLEYFEWRFQNVYGKEGIPRVQRQGLHDYFDDEGKNTIGWCRIAERFVKERLAYYPEESKRTEIVIDDHKIA